MEFYVHVTVHRNKFLFGKTNRRINFSKFIFVKKLPVSGSSSAHHQEFLTKINLEKFVRLLVLLKRILTECSATRVYKLPVQHT